MTNNLSTIIKEAENKAREKFGEFLGIPSTQAEYNSFTETDFHSFLTEQITKAYKAGKQSND